MASRKREEYAAAGLNMPKAMLSTLLSHALLRAAFRCALWARLHQFREAAQPPCSFVARLARLLLPCTAGGRASSRTLTQSLRTYRYYYYYY